ncbi:hypothetical protein ACH5RR_040534 [Cinchona calisaya]|uniref:Uncharacterized protein n=1 Tax=Cinchona calisaya TaxID=153742 RepID=A0ABD2XRY6_9GENT
MAEANGVEEDKRPKIMPPYSLFCGKRTLAQDLIMHESPGSVDIPKHVVIVMDGLKEFSMDPLEWVLKNVANGASSSCTVTLLGVMPWLNIPLSSKTWSDIWSMDLEYLSMIKEWKNDAKYQKVRVLLDLCHHYGVELEIRTEMGHPLRLLVVEQISSLHATLVVFDRYHDTKYIEYYAEKLPCNMVKMNEDGEVDMIRGRSRIDSVESTPGDDSSYFVAPSPKVIFSEQIKKLLKQRSRSYKQESFGKKIIEATDFPFGCLNGIRDK